MVFLQKYSQTTRKRIFNVKKRIKLLNIPIFGGPCGALQLSTLPKDFPRVQFSDHHDALQIAVDIIPAKGVNLLMCEAKIKCYSKHKPNKYKRKIKF